jgi:hypothetical protein
MNQPGSSPFGTQFLHDPTRQIAAVEHIVYLRRTLIDLKDRFLRRPQERRELSERLDEEVTAAFLRHLKETGNIKLSERTDRRPEEVVFDQETDRLKKEIKNTEIEIERYRLVLQVAAGHNPVKKRHCRVKYYTG